jgi:hypothetical protein
MKHSGAGVMLIAGSKMQPETTRVRKPIRISVLVTKEIDKQS